MEKSVRIATTLVTDLGSDMPFVEHVPVRSVIGWREAETVNCRSLTPRYRGKYAYRIRAITCNLTGAPRSIAIFCHEANVNVWCFLPRTLEVNRVIHAICRSSAKEKKQTTRTVVVAA